MQANIPTGWARAKLVDLATYINGRAFKPSEWQYSGIPIVRIQNLNSNTAVFNFSNEQYDKKYSICKNELLYAWSASLGAYIWKGDSAWLNQHIFKVLPNDGIDKYYLYYLLTMITAELYAKSHGSGMVHVTKGKFEETEVLIPPSREQKRIVAKIEELFSELDNGIATLKTAREQLKVYRQSLLKHAFEGKLTAKWREENTDKLETPKQLLVRIQKERDDRYQQQLKEWEITEKYIDKSDRKKKKLRKPTKPTAIQEHSDKSLTKLPKNWVWIEYAGICEQIRNGISAKPIGAIGAKIFRISAVRAMEFNLNDFRYLLNDEGKYNDYFLSKGDLVFTRYNGTRDYVGVCAEYRGDGTHLYPDKLIQTRVAVDTINTSYLEKAINCGDSRNFIEKRIRTTAGQSGISGGDLKTLPVPVCSSDEQMIINEYLTIQLSYIVNMDAQIDQALTKAETLRQSILKKAFSGNLVPQDSNDEPASALLSRIKQVKSSGNKTTFKKPTKETPLK